MVIIWNNEELPKGNLQKFGDRKLDNSFTK